MWSKVPLFRLTCKFRVLINNLSLIKLTCAPWRDSLVKTSICSTLSGLWLWPFKENYMIVVYLWVGLLRPQKHFCSEFVCTKSILLLINLISIKLSTDSSGFLKQKVLTAFSEWWLIKFTFKFVNFSIA